MDLRFLHAFLFDLEAVLMEALFSPIRNNTLMHRYGSKFYGRSYEYLDLRIIMEIAKGHSFTALQGYSRQNQWFLCTGSGGC